MSDIVNPLQALSYTNKDFVSIYTELLDLTKELAAYWDPTISNESDPGVILLKLNAIIGDKLSYNSDTNVLELFPLSVTQQKNARQLFEQLGYYMHWYRAATTNVSILWEGAKNSTVEYTIPAFTTVSDYNNTVIYTLVGPVDGTTINTFKVGSQKLKLDGSTTSFKAIQGIPVVYSLNSETTITVNNLDSDNRLYFPTTDIAENGIFITNINANNYTDWKKVDNLLVQTVSEENLFYSFGVTQDTSTCYIEFPENAEEIIKNGINITYIKTLGQQGNVAYKTIEKFYSEISPEEDSSVVFTTENIRMLNYNSAINGEDPESINSAYKHYKSTVGVFETLVTLRDYIGYILRSDLISNGFVCDRTNDVQCSYNIMSQSNDIDQLVNVIEKEGATPELNAFDLKLYLLQLPNNEIVTNTVYNTTFDLLDNANQNTVKQYIDDVKCISHDYAPILSLKENPGRSHFCLFKVKYPISCRVVTQYKLTNTATNEVIKNIRESLYKNLNSKEMTFGEEVSQELIYTLIMKADDRIKNVMLDNIDYTAYVTIYVDNDSYKGFYDIEISSTSAPIIYSISNEDLTVEINGVTLTEKIGVDNYSVFNFKYDSIQSKWLIESSDGTFVDEGSDDILSLYGITVTGTPSNDDTLQVRFSLKTQLQEEILMKSVLAGATQFFVQDEEFDYRLDQKMKSFECEVLKDIYAVSTELDINIDRVNNTYNLRDNESIQLFSPNLIDSTTYSTYVKYEYRLTNALSADEDYQLTDNEYFIMYWKESEADNEYRYAVYGSGNIIRIKSFDLGANDGSNNAGSELVNYLTNIGTDENPVLYTDSTMNNRMNYTINQKIYNMDSGVKQLSSSKSITIRKINQLELNAGNSYCYWILNNKVEDSSGNEKYRLFEEGEFSKILSSGEYFIYTNETLTNLTILGAGTQIFRTDSEYVWEVNVKDASSILENGITAFSEDEWFRIVPSDSSIILTEQHFVYVNSGSDFRMQLAKNQKDYCDVSISSCPINLSVAIDKDAWFKNVSGYGSYTFTYTVGSGDDSTGNWKDDQEHIVNLESIGLSVSGSPNNNDEIVVYVSDWKLKLSPDNIYKCTTPEGTSGVVSAEGIGDKVTFSVGEAVYPISKLIVDISSQDGVSSVNVYVSPAENVAEATTYTVNLGTTVHDGTLDVISGELIVNGETTQLTPTEVMTISGTNNIWADCGGIQVYYGFSTDQWTNTTLKDFLLSYKSAGSTSYTPIDVLNLYSDDYTWRARTLLAINTSNTQEQILLSNQRVNFFLLGKYYYKGEALTTSTLYCFEIDDEEYEFTSPSTASEDITEFIFDEESMTVYFPNNSNVVNVVEGSGTGSQVEVKNFYTLEGTDLNTVTSVYNSVIMSNFDLKLDGSQTLQTYNITENLELEYLNIYSYGKYISNTTKIHINSDGEIDLEFVVGESNIISLEFNLPVGEYILPLTVGTEELEDSGYVKAYLNSSPLHIINDETLVNFNKNKKYFIYFKITDNSSNQTLSIEVNDDIEKNVPVILSNVYKYYYKEGLSNLQIMRFLKLFNVWDSDTLYNYTYKVPSDVEISKPLLGKSFLLSNHIFNKYTIPQMGEIEINVLGRK